MKKNIYYVLLAIPIFLSGCKGSTEKKADNQSADTIINFAKTNTDVPKFGLKSAIIEMKSQTMGMEQIITMYIDDYGNKKATEADIKLFGKNIKQYTISDTSYIYSFNNVDKTGTKTKIDKNDPENINFNAITEDAAYKLKLKKKGTAKVLDKQCDVYTMEFTDKKMKGTFYIWKGYILKSESVVAGITVKIEAIRFEENPVIPSEKFIIPQDITFKEIKGTEQV